MKALFHLAVIVCLMLFPRLGLGAEPVKLPVAKSVETKLPVAKPPIKKKGCNFGCSTDCRCGCADGAPCDCDPLRGLTSEELRKIDPWYDWADGKMPVAPTPKIVPEVMPPAGLFQTNEGSLVYPDPNNPGMYIEWKKGVLPSAATPFSHPSSGVVVGTTGATKGTAVPIPAASTSPLLTTGATPPKTTAPFEFGGVTATAPTITNAPGVVHSGGIEFGFQEWTARDAAGNLWKYKRNPDGSVTACSPYG